MNEKLVKQALLLLEHMCVDSVELGEYLSEQEIEYLRDLHVDVHDQLYRELGLIYDHTTEWAIRLNADDPDELKVVSNLA